MLIPYPFAAGEIQSCKILLQSTAASLTATYLCIYFLAGCYRELTTPQDSVLISGFNGHFRKHELTILSNKNSLKLVHEVTLSEKCMCITIVI